MYLLRHFVVVFLLLIRGINAGAQEFEEFRLDVDSCTVAVYFTSAANAMATHYKIQQGPDTTKWATITDMPASREGAHYASTLTQQSYKACYRILAFTNNTLLDSSQVLSATIPCKSDEQSYLSIYPNPLRRGDPLHMTIWVPDSSDGIALIYAPDGRLALELPLSLMPGMQTLKIPDTKDWHQGIYLLKIRNLNGIPLSRTCLLSVW
jgi:hypothetical protein